MTTENAYGLSKKTNITIAAIAAMATAAEHAKGLLAIATVAIIAVSYQFVLDLKKTEKTT